MSRRRRAPRVPRAVADDAVRAMLDAHRSMIRRAIGELAGFLADERRRPRYVSDRVSATIGTLYVMSGYYRHHDHPALPELEREINEAWAIAHAAERAAARAELARIGAGTLPIAGDRGDARPPLPAQLGAADRPDDVKRRAPQRVRKSAG